MPSVRIKKHSYSSLGNQSVSPSEGYPPRSLANLFKRGPQEGPSSRSPHEGPTTGRIPTATTMGRRTGSRVQDHLLPLLGQERGRARAMSLPHRYRLNQPSPVGSGVVTLEGEAVDVQVSGGGEPGRIDSALSLSSYNDPEISELDHHHDDIVEHLDVIDPQVATATDLTNAANSILIPPFSFYSRRPVVTLSPPPLPTIDSARTSEEEGQTVLEDSLDRHVEDVMKRRDKIRRSLKGVWSFLKTPLGIVTGIYGFLVVFWGAAIVFFLAKIINFHNANTQGFWVEVSSQVVNGLFTVTGIGLIPSRVLDTIRISKIYSYKRRTRELRAKAGLPQLFDEDDLPDPLYDPNYVHVLTDKEQKDLHRRMCHEQLSIPTPHGTETHRAFPIGYALLICCLNDMNSVFQIILCGTMWGLNRFQRPAWSTGILIPLGFLSGIGAAVFIFLGSKKTKRTEEVEKRLKAALNSDYDGSEEHESSADIEDTVSRPSDVTGLKAIAEGSPGGGPSGEEEEEGVDEDNIPAAAKESSIVS
ncbi:hypothetical protein BT96DRAFT_996076 [Gymnopus androsaceus JB14]|uniref:Uncharacterized protein n=1 Tax=Gymnopus androsaceus JB14 TaxID=1447944 RepID=A0A6A4HHV1_9AGAR|nr:hypothetical protein BT96DRAFT_996076 [Gymnopus androsaceus JB14]